MALVRMVRGGRYRVAPGSQDIRGWRLFDQEGAPAGTVAGLLFDPDALRVRSAIVDTGTRRVVVPIGLIEARRGAREAVVRGHTVATLAMIAPYDEAAHEDDAPPRGGLWSLFGPWRAS